MNASKSYWGNIISVVRSMWSGLRITFDHVLKARTSKKLLGIQDDTYFNQAHGIATIQYPHETLPVPDTGRYQLHNEIDDCIVCDKCVKICPVDCITIEPVRATEEIGRTSDGTPKRIFAARFDIDMGKCCFCGLCTTVCPTECLTMTKTYDFSTFDIREHNFEFAEMTPAEIEEKKKLLEIHQQAKIATLASNPAPPAGTLTDAPKSPRPVFKPKIKPPGS
jgi:NADH-quinone oxidoreductase subunit I